MAWTPIRRLRAARKMFTDDAEAVNGIWRRHLINVDLEYTLCDTGNWYITVIAPSGSKMYDGWWRDSSGKTAAEAVAEAFRGAQLLGAD